MLTKILKIMYLMIGLMLLFMLGGEVIRKLSGKPAYEYPYAEDIMVGTKLEEFLKDGKIPQGFTYDSPTQLPNSEFKMLPLSMMTYQEAKDFADMRDRSGDIHLSLANYVNILFLDKDYTVKRQLLDSLGAISDIEVPYSSYRETADTTIRNILYVIAFKDTNKDNLLNSEDEGDLYISDMDGGNLLQITRGVKVKEYWFKEGNTQVFIHYTPRNDQREEHKRKMFAIYDIKTQELKMLDGITETINTLEAKVIRTGPAK